MFVNEAVLVSLAILLFVCGVAWAIKLARRPSETGQRQTPRGGWEDIVRSGPQRLPPAAFDTPGPNSQPSRDSSPAAPQFAAPRPTRYLPLEALGDALDLELSHLRWLLSEIERDRLEGAPRDRLERG